MQEPCRNTDRQAADSRQQTYRQVVQVLNELWCKLCVFENNLYIKFVVPKRRNFYV